MIAFGPNGSLRWLAYHWLMPRSSNSKSTRSTTSAKAIKPPAKPRARKPKAVAAEPAGAMIVGDVAATSGETAASVNKPNSSQQAAAKAFAIQAARLLRDMHCEDVLVLDVRNLSQLSDYIVLASGTSDRQMRACADHLADLAEGSGHTAMRRNIDDRTTWVVLDCVDVVCHIFEPNTRAHYDLEMLWGDAKRLDWQPAAGEAIATAASRAQRNRNVKS